MQWSSTGSSSSKWKGRLADSLAVSKPEGITKAFNQDAVARLAESDVQWLGERRLDAWRTYESMPLPARDLEEWRYTDIGMFKLDKVVLADPAWTEIPDAARAMLERGEKAGYALAID